MGDGPGAAMGGRALERIKTVKLTRLCHSLHFRPSLLSPRARLEEKRATISFELLQVVLQTRGWREEPIDTVDGWWMDGRDGSCGGAQAAVRYCSL